MRAGAVDSDRQVLEKVSWLSQKKGDHPADDICTSFLTECLNTRFVLISGLIRLIINNLELSHSRICLVNSWAQLPSQYLRNRVVEIDSSMLNQLARLGISTSYLLATCFCLLGETLAALVLWISSIRYFHIDLIRREWALILRTPCRPQSGTLIFASRSQLFSNPTIEVFP